MVLTGDISTIHTLGPKVRPRSIHLTGCISDMTVSVLIDSGSTHNFIKPAVAEELNLPVHPITPFRVFVGNGASLRCNYACLQTPLFLQGHQFIVDLFILQVEGPDLILGVQWLQELGNVTKNYLTLSMKFDRDNMPIVLQGEDAPPKLVSYNGLLALLSVDTTTELYEMVALPPATADRFDAPTVARLFIAMVVKLHGFPTCLLSVRDPFFMREFWNELFALSGMKLQFTTAYHPQMDGQSEVTNPAVEQYLRASTHECPTRWYDLLPSGELTLDCSTNISISMSPFQALYGREPPNLFRTYSHPSRHQAVADLLKEREATLKVLRGRIAHAQQLITNSENKQRHDVEFNVGDLVLLRLQPHRQHNVSAKSFPSWEPVSAFRREFPHLHLEDKVVFLDGGVDRALTTPAHTNDEPAQSTSNSSPSPSATSPTQPSQMESTRPTRIRSRPNRFKDFLLY